MPTTKYKKNPNEDTAYYDDHKVQLIAIPDGTLQLPIHPTSDSGYVVDTNGKKHRVLMATFLSGTPDFKKNPNEDTAYMTINSQKVKVRLAVKENGTLTLSDKPNVNTGFVIGNDSNKHRALLVSTPTGTLELPNSETDDSAYVVDSNGKKHKVRMFVLLAGGYVEVIVKGTSPLSLPDAITDSLSYVKAFGGTEHVAENYIDSVTVDGKCEQRNLPDNYIQRDYIYMMDGSYLLTDIVPTSDCKIEMDFATTSVSANSDTYLGARTGLDVGAGARLGKDTTKKAVFDWFKTGSRYTSDYTFTDNTRYKFVAENSTLTLSTGGSDVATNTFTPTGTTTEYLAINGFNINGTVTASHDGLYLYSFKVWNGQGELVMDLVPAIQKGTVPVVGFYDTVSGTFKTATAGTFAAGSETMPTPDAPMDIWCNNGKLKVSPNLFDKDANILTNGWVLNVADSVLKRQADGYTWAIPCAPNTTYTVSHDAQNPNTVLRIAYGTMQDLSFTSGTADQPIYSVQNGSVVGDYRTTTITTGANATYLFVQLGATNQATAKETTQVELGSTATPYMPYGQIYTDGTAEVLTDDVGNTASVANVLSCGDFKDTQEILTGAITHNVGIKVLDGTENWQLATGTNLVQFYTPDTLGVIANNVSLTSTIAPYGCTVANRTEYDFGCYSGNSGYLCFQMKGSATLTTMSAWKQYLTDQYVNGTPVIVVYPLATATTESVAGQVLTKTPVTQTAGSLTTNITTVATDHTVPTPTQPLDINCNNGVLKARHQSGLPLGYTLLEYIESTGTQYIDMGIKPNQNISVEIKYNLTELIQSPSASTMLFGSRDAPSTTDASNGIFRTLTWNINKVAFGSGNGTNVLLTGTIGQATDTDYVLKFDKNAVYYNNVLRTTIPAVTQTWSSLLNMYLFSVNTNGVSQYNCKAKIYYTKIWDNDTLVRNFVPCKNPNNEVGMYDTVTGTFFGNAGTGDFTAGNTVSDPVEIYADGTVETLGIICNNLVEGELKANINSSGVVVSAPTTYAWYAPVTPGETYTYKNPVLYAFFTEKPVIGSVSYNNARTVSSNPTFTVPNDPSIKYVGFRNNSTGGYCVKGSELYAGGTATCEDLLSVGNYTDVQSIIDGVVTRNVGVKVLNGTENWTTTDTFYNYVLGTSQTGDLLCSHFQTSGDLYLRIIGTRLRAYVVSQYTTVTQWKQYLADQYNAGHPVIVVYPLATATTESVAGQTLQVQDGDNVLEITQASMDGLELEAKYNKNA